MLGGRRRGRVATVVMASRRGSTCLGARLYTRAPNSGHARRSLPLCPSSRPPPFHLRSSQPRVCHTNQFGTDYVYHMKRPTPALSLYRNTYIVAALIPAYHKPSRMSPTNGTSFTCARSSIYGIKK